MQYEKHPDSGEVLLKEETIRLALLSHKMVKRWAYICHDKDVYSALDEEQNSEHHQGEVKPRHWHIVLELGTRQIEIGVVANWFKIKDNYVETAKGTGAFLDCVQYLTHEKEKQQQLGKRLYEDSEVRANFDFREELNIRADRRATYGRDVDEATAMRLDVLRGKKTLAQCEYENPVIYEQERPRLEKNRIAYLNKTNPPINRLNFYIHGAGGEGKTLLSIALARQFYNSFLSDSVRSEDTPYDDDVYFTISGNKTSLFEGYDGQPIIIWDDVRPEELLKLLGGRGNCFNVFDSHPRKIRQNIKYSSVNLVNAVNIINSVVPFFEFRDVLAGAYTDKNGVLHLAEDKNQVNRRFPMFVVLHENDFDIQLNKGVMDGDKNDFGAYIFHGNFVGSMKKLHDKLSASEKLSREYDARLVDPIIKAVPLIKDKNPEITPEVLAEFENVGKRTDNIKADSATVTESKEKQVQQLIDEVPELPPNYYDTLEPPPEDDEYYDMTETMK